MSEPSNLGVCDVCGVGLASTHRYFGFQRNQISYSLPGETPDQQAALTYAGTHIRARFCRSTCSKSQLSSWLAMEGLPPEIVSKRIGGGPIYPCICCSKPVNLNHSHTAWVKGQQTASWDDGWSYEADWFDVMAVACSECSGAQQSLERELETRRINELV